MNKRVLSPRRYIKMTVKELTEANERLQVEIVDKQAQLKRKDGKQVKQNRQCKMTTAVQKATQKLLQTAFTI